MYVFLCVLIDYWQLILILCNVSSISTNLSLIQKNHSLKICTNVHMYNPAIIIMLQTHTNLTRRYSMQTSHQKNISTMDSSK